MCEDGDDEKCCEEGIDRYVPEEVVELNPDPEEL